ncbi:hypothetical protein ACJU26_01380 [Acidithiobacillus sp. M4-SHS-6]
MASITALIRRKWLFVVAIISARGGIGLLGYGQFFDVIYYVANVDFSSRF